MVQLIIKLRSVIFCFAVLSFIVISAGQSYARKWIHPRNKYLIAKGLLPVDILKYFPDVPKLTPYEALALYRSGKAIFIAIGHDSPRLPTGWLLEDNSMSFNPRKLKRYGIPTRGKYIILYCG